MRSIIIEGKAQPKERARVIRGHAYTPTKTAQYEQRIARAWAAKYPDQLGGDLRVSVIFSMSLPTSWSGVKKERARLGVINPSVRPDLDNLVKAVLDGLNGVAFLDDKQVIELFARKEYADEPRTLIRVEEL